MNTLQIKYATFKLKWFQKYQPLYYQKIIDFLKKNPFLQQFKDDEIIWHWYYNVTEPIMCQTCKTNRTAFMSKTIGYRKYCSRKCQANSKEVKEKRKQTNVTNFGTEFPLQSEKCQNKFKHTCLERFGVENPYQNETIKDKIKETNLERYGVENILQNLKIKKDVMFKKRETTIEKYGVENVFQLEHVKEKIKETNLKRYGLENHLSYEYKNYVFPSGKTIKVQGYEHYAINILLQQYKEDDILISKEINQLFKFYYTFNDKVCRYYPDLYIKSENKIIDVKSHYTYNKNLEKNNAKRNAVLNEKLNFEFMIITPNKRKNPDNFIVEKF